jgi:hypothetical protein
VESTRVRTETRALRTGAGSVAVSTESKLSFATLVGANPASSPSLGRDLLDASASSPDDAELVDW